MINFYITAFLIVMTATLYWLYQRDALKVKNGRANIFNDCINLLSETSKKQVGTGFPSLQGMCAGYQVSMEVIEDTLTARKVPPLWLTVTVMGNAPSYGSLDIIVRPQNTEFYSPSWHWDGNLQIPPGWPQHAIVKYQYVVAPLEVLNDFVPKLFVDAKVKELLVTPTMVRITYLAKQAERGEYMLMRNALFDGAPINKAEVEVLLDHAIKIRHSLESCPDIEKAH